MCRAWPSVNTTHFDLLSPILASPKHQDVHHGYSIPLRLRRPSLSTRLSLKWSFQLLLDLEHRTFIGRHGFNDDDLAYELALEMVGR